MVETLEGIVCDDTGEPRARICSSCFLSLRRSEKPPKFSIRNGFAFGCLPAELRDCTPVEHALASRVRTIGLFQTVTFGNKGLRGHAISFHVSPNSVSNLLPDVAAVSETIQVVLVSARTPEEVARAKRPCRCRVAKVRGLLDFYIRNNRAYQGQVSVNTHALAALPEDDVLPNTFMQTNDNECATSVERMHDNHALPHTDTFETAQPQTEVVHASMIAAQGQPGTERQHAIDEMRRMISRCSSAVVAEYQKESLCISFPELFPFGLGGMDDPNRVVKVSKEEHVRHLLRLANRSFAQHPTFVLIAFDQLTRARGMQQAWLTSQFPSNNVADLPLVTLEQLQHTAEHQEATIAALRSGQPPPETSIAETLATNLLRHVKSSRAKMLGTNEERDAARNKMWSYFYFFGAPTLFVTINPYDAGSIELRNFMHQPVPPGIRVPQAEM